MAPDPLSPPEESTPRPGDGTDLAGVSYAAAVTELEEILERLDGDDVDVDELAEQVRRAAALIARCRERLASTRLEVTRIVADLDTLTTSDPSTDDEDAAADDGDEDDEDDAADEGQR